MTFWDGAIIGCFKIFRQTVQAVSYRIIYLGNILLVSVKKFFFFKLSVNHHEINFAVIHIRKNLQEKLAIDIINVLFYFFYKCIKVHI